MRTFDVIVRNKIAVANIGPDDLVVCGNSDYSVAFDLDEEWSAYDTKTARFNLSTGGYIDQVFQGSVCPMPVMANQWRVAVGLFAGDLHTSTPAFIPCARSIRCEGGAPVDPPADVYDQIMEVLNSGGVSEEKIASVLEKYLDEHPISVTVDTELSKTSTNPVQNRAVTEKLDELETDIGNIDVLLDTI